jgi:hypothetical protein
MEQAALMYKMMVIAVFGAALVASALMARPLSMAVLLLLYLLPTTLQSEKHTCTTIEEAAGSTFYLAGGAIVLSFLLLLGLRDYGDLAAMQQWCARLHDHVVWPTSLEDRYASTVQLDSNDVSSQVEMMRNLRIQRVVYAAYITIIVGKVLAIPAALVLWLRREKLFVLFHRSAGKSNVGLALFSAATVLSSVGMSLGYEPLAKLKGGDMMHVMVGSIGPMVQVSVAFYAAYMVSRLDPSSYLSEEDEKTGVG